MRYAIIAGNRHAPLLYALTYPERFDKTRPLRLFEFRGIRCVFAGYYFPQRYENWLCDDQSGFVRKVYDFKEGRDPCRNCFSQAFRILSVTGDVTAMFMHHGRQGEQTHFRKTFRSGYGQLHDGEGAAGKTGRNRG